MYPQECECSQDGFCARYQRMMTGRWREICQGVDCDRGTSAAFRQQWLDEARQKEQQPVKPTQSGGATELILRTHQAPGDAVAMTSAIHSLHRAHPGKYLTAIESHWQEVFQYNPDVVSPSSLNNPSLVQMHYPGINQCNQRGIHFMQAWCEFLSCALGVNIPLLTNRPHLYFPPDGQEVKQGRYWLICAGGKEDFTTKLWGHERYQRVVDLLRGRVHFIQVGANEREHPPLRNVAYSTVGKTSLRQLFEQTRRARGVLCGVSLLMHVAAALEKPAVVIAGGREPVQWNAYPLQHYVHTVGVLPCTSIQGDRGVACWRSRIESSGDESILNEKLCERPIQGTPECMTLITPEEVAEIILRCSALEEEGTQRVALDVI